MAKCFEYPGSTNYCPGSGAPGRFERGLLFDGALRYVYLPPGRLDFTTAAGGAQPQSVELWFRANAPGVLLGYYNNDWVPMLYVGADGRLRAQIKFGCQTQFTGCALNGSPVPASVLAAPLTSAEPVTDTQWHHLALVSSPELSAVITDTNGPQTVAGAVVRLYLDGELVGAANGLILAEPVYQLNGSDFYLGLSVPPFTEPWPSLPPPAQYGYLTYAGRLDEVALYTRTLAA